jgi:hypothetical protein
MKRCAGQSTTEFMLMVILMVMMAAAVRFQFWNALPRLHAQVVERVAVDGKLNP